MKQLVVLSGKGGTGKTTVAAALAHLMAREERVVLADADVDAPNLGLILQPEVEAESEFIGGGRAIIEPVRCSGCGLCERICRFDAISAQGEVYAVDQTACEGCAACVYQCPRQAISMAPVVSGRLYRSRTRFGHFVHARLFPGEENSGKLVSAVRRQAIEVAEQQGADWVLVDGSPGTGCPVIAAVTGADLALMVAEPTVSGRHDLERVLAVAAHFRVPTAVCLNKCDLNAEVAGEIEALCAELGVPVLARLPYDEVVTAAMRRALAVTEHSADGMARALADLWQALRERRWTAT